MGKADQLRQKMHKSETPVFSPRPSVEVRPLPKTTDEDTKTVSSSENSSKEEVAIAKPAKKIVDNGEEIINYATYITRRQKKQIKLRAVETGVKDLDIVQSALDEYFKNNPL